MTQVVTTLELDTKTLHEPSWQVMLYNCDCHTFDEVAERLMMAIRCNAPTAWQYAHVVHTLGSASVFRGVKGECERIADIIGATGIRVEVIQ